MSLSPTKRIKLISEISDRLSLENYSVIDLTLTQFKLPVSESWSGNTKSYVIGMIQGAGDQTLTDLAEHVGYKLESSSSPGLDPSFWRKDMLRVFVSHLAAHKVLAAAVQSELLHFGISGFVAHNDIDPTLEWQNQIETALATCDGLVALLHAGFHASNWTDQEIGFAMGRGVPVFSVRFDQDPYGFIGRFQAFNGHSKTPATIARELFEVYRKNKQTEPKMAEVLVSLFEQSGSFAEAKTRIGYLEEIAYWQPSFSFRITSATESNSQVQGSWGVPDRVKLVVKKRAAAS